MPKVAASSLRKGAVVDVDGKLYVVLTVENIHPGKGTPVTQLDMRRISDGVKVSERWRTTEQVERAFVDQRPHTFLYQDGEGFHFMNPESYDQLVVPEEMVGASAAYLQDGMTVELSTHEGRPIALELPGPRDAGGHRHRARDQGPDRLRVVQARGPLKRRPHRRAAIRHRRHPRGSDDRGRLVRGAREGLIPTAPACGGGQDAAINASRSSGVSGRQRPSGRSPRRRGPMRMRCRSSTHRFTAAHIRRI